MGICKHKTVILSVLMILVLLTTWMAAPLSYSRAVLAEVIVVGEVVMTLASLASLMMIALGASGMDGALRNQAAATGTQPLTYVGQLLNRWLSSSSSNMGFSLLAQKMQEGLSYLPDGTLYLDSEATAAVADFQRWAWDVEGADLVDYDNATIDEHSALTQGGVPLYTGVGIERVGTSAYYVDPATATNFLNGESRPSSVTIQLSGGRWYAVFYDSRLYAISSVPGTNLATATKNTNGIWSASYYGSGTSNRSWVRFTLGPTDAGASWVPTVSALPSYDDVVGAVVGGAVSTGDVSTFVGPMQQGQGTMLPLSNTVTVSADAAARLHLDNYLRAVASAYAGTGTASVPVTDVGTGDEDTLPLSVPLDSPIGVTGVSDSTIDQSGSVAGSDSVATDFEGLDDYTMDLTQFFPFCVPFDLAYLFEKLRADPEALVIDWHFMIPYLDVDIPIEIDLSPFDSLAQLLRSLEVIAFIVALMIGTKNLIQGGD